MVACNAHDGTTSAIAVASALVHSVAAASLPKGAHDFHDDPVNLNRQKPIGEPKNMSLIPTSVNITESSPIMRALFILAMVSRRIGAHTQSRIYTGKIKS
jgi:hypothetical protein